MLHARMRYTPQRLMGHTEQFGCVADKLAPLKPRPCCYTLPVTAVNWKPPWHATSQGRGARAGVWR